MLTDAKIIHDLRYESREIATILMLSAILVGHIKSLFAVLSDFLLFRGLPVGKEEVFLSNQELVLSRSSERMLLQLAQSPLNLLGSHQVFCFFHCVVQT